MSHHHVPHHTRNHGPTAAPIGNGDALFGGQECEMWNDFFIVTTAASLLMLLFNAYLCHRRDSSHRHGVVDWGVPSGIGLFLSHIALWNLAPPNVFFVLFKEAFPTLLPGATTAACMAVINVPYFAITIIPFLFQIVFFYRPAALVDSTAFALCDDEDLLESEGEAEYNDPQLLDKERQVLLIGATVARGRLLVARSQARTAWKTGQQGQQQQELPPRYVARTLGVIFPCLGYQASAGYVKNNLETMNADPETYTIVFGDRKYQSRENVFQLPLSNDCVDKVVFTPFVRSGPPVGNFSAEESTKAKRMAMLLDEVIRVLKPGGQIVWPDAATYAVFAYADLRDKLGAENVELVDEGRKLKTTLTTYPLPLLVTVATKPENFVPVSPGSASSPIKTPNSAVSVQSTDYDDSEIVVTDDMIDESRAETQMLRNHKLLLPQSTIYAVLIPVQLAIFLLLCFGVVALFEPLNIPTNIPVEQRVGASVLSLATTYPLMAFFEREYVIQATHFSSASRVLKYMLKSSSVAIVATVVFTLLLSLPTLALQIGLAHTSLDATVRSIIGFVISVLIGVLFYKFQTRRRNVKMLKSRHLPVEYIKYL